VRLSQRRGATSEELQQSRTDILWRMVFASIIMYFIMLSMDVLFKSGKTEITSAAQAAQALQPLAGKALDCYTPSTF
jgi:Mn2+/Fe2+ NRAMP family transporter